MRKYRIGCWIIVIVLVFGYVTIQNNFTEKEPVYVYAPEDMELGFNQALAKANMDFTHEIVISDDIASANIVVETGKEFDSEYTKIGYSPFVVAYSDETKNIDNMIKSGLLQSAFFDNNYKEINFIKVIDEALSEGKWENLGVKDMGDLKVYYPKVGNQYYSDFYDFMLVTINNGVYPENETDLKSAMEKIELFENSKYTEGVEDFGEKFARVGGFAENVFYLIPEQKVSKMAGESECGRLFYPTTTVYVNYYIKAVDELGHNVITDVDKKSIWDKFYSGIKYHQYRTDNYSQLGEFSDYLEDERDVFNVLHLEKDRLRPVEAE